MSDQPPPRPRVVAAVGGPPDGLYGRMASAAEVAAMAAGAIPAQPENQGQYSYNAQANREAIARARAAPQR